MCTPLRFVKLLNLVAKSSRHNGKWGLCEDCLCTALSISIGQQLQLVIQSAYTSLRWAFWWKKSCHPLMKMTEAALFSREFIRRGKKVGRRIMWVTCNAFYCCKRGRESLKIHYLFELHKPLCVCFWLCTVCTWEREKAREYDSADMYAMFLRVMGAVNHMICSKSTSFLL